MSTRTTAVVGVIASTSIHVLMSGGPIFLYKVVEVLDRASEQLTIVGEAVHYGVLMESLGDAGYAANTQTLYIFGNSSNDVFKVLGRYSLDIL